MFKYLKPIPFEMPKDAMLGHIFYSVKVADIFNPDVYFYKSFKGLSIGDATEVVYMGEIPPILEDTSLYFGTQNHINNCVNNAETIDIKLKNILSRLITDQEVLKSLSSIDFMKRRDLFSDILKSLPIIKSISQFDTVKKLQQITKPFYDFIIERNIYTHGALHLLYPEKRLLIEYIQNNKIVYCEVNSEILLSYNNIYRTILTFLSLIEVLLDPIDEERVGNILKQYNSLRIL